eukprot:2810465-Rhodomonas_salina.3
MRTGRSILGVHDCLGTVAGGGRGAGVRVEAERKSEPLSLVREHGQHSRQDFEEDCHEVRTTDTVYRSRVSVSEFGETLWIAPHQLRRPAVSVHFASRMQWRAVDFGSAPVACVKSRGWTPLCAPCVETNGVERGHACA